MPRSSSATPSDSSHDSESPRRRAASVTEDAMELDHLSTVSDDCEHIVAFKASSRMLANYDKGLNWSASSALAKALDMLSGTVFCGSCDDFHMFERSQIDDETPNTAMGPSGESISTTSNVYTEVFRSRAKETGRPALETFHGRESGNSKNFKYFLRSKKRVFEPGLCEQQNCMCCELDQLFTETFSEPSSSGSIPEAPAGTGPPLGPLSLLRTTWENSNDIAGYAQHDAHEYFIAVLNQLHHGCPGSTHEASCNCSIHQIFAGQLQSDVKCGKCGHVNPTVDPMLDISLELKGIQEGKGITLASCQEKLQPKAYVCGQCHSSSSVSKLGCFFLSTHYAQEATKQLSIKKLPPVLCIQLKIDIPVKFPVVINMTPYTTAAIGMRDKDTGPRDLNALPTYDYELFGVINHEGQLNTGHYTNFARHQSELISLTVRSNETYRKGHACYSQRSSKLLVPPAITIDTNIVSAVPAESSSDRIYLGTNLGNLLVYSLDKTEGNDLIKHSIQSSSDLLLDGTFHATLEEVKKSLVRRSVEQLGFIKDTYSLISLAAPPKVIETRGALCFSLDTTVIYTNEDGTTTNTKDPSAKQIPAVVTLLAIGCRRRIVIFSWKDGEPQMPPK
ncbi:9699_t:CDS:10, partial [Acaulospora colombiana]